MIDRFESLWHLNATIKSDLRELENLRSVAFSIGTSSVEERVKGGVIENKVESCIIKIVDLERKIADEVNECITLKEEIIDIINGQNNETDRVILRLRYIECLTWGAIADRLGYSERQIYRLRKRALDNLG